MANIGNTLRAARVKRGLSIEQAAQDTRISRKFLEAIEAEDFGALPAPVYVRGFLRSYANYLRVDPLPLLDQVNTVLERPVSGPDSFVSGPSTPQRPRGGSDPWRRRGVEQAPPSRQPFGRRQQEDEYDDEEPEYEETVPAPNLRLRETRGEPPMPERPRGVVPYPPPFPARPNTSPPPPVEEEEVYEDEYEDEQQYEAVPPRFVPPMEMAGDTYEQPRRRRAAGVLDEREERERGGIPPMFLAIAGGAFVLGVFGVLAFLLFRSDPTDNTPGAGDDPTATVNITTQVAVGSRTPSPSVSASASASVSTTGTPSVTGTPGTPGTGTPSPTATQQGNATATPTSPGEPTATPSPTTEASPTPTATTAPPTATSVPPTATSVPPTPTPPLIDHPFGYAECAGGNCGSPPLLIVCAPDGWFVDVGRNFPNPGWTTREVIKAADAQGVCP